MAEQAAEEDGCRALGRPTRGRTHQEDRHRRAPLEGCLGPEADELQAEQVRHAGPRALRRSQSHDLGRDPNIHREGLRLGWDAAREQGQLRHFEERPEQGASPCRPIQQRRPRTPIPAHPARDPRPKPAELRPLCRGQAGPSQVHPQREDPRRPPAPGE